MLNLMGKEKPVLAKNIIARRKALGFKSAMKFAEAARIPYPTLRDIEAGKSEGWKETREAIATALGCTFSDLYQTSRSSESADMRAKIKLQLDSQSPSEKQMGDFVLEILEENKSLRAKLEASVPKKLPEKSASLQTVWANWGDATPEAKALCLYVLDHQQPDYLSLLTGEQRKKVLAAARALGLKPSKETS